MRTLIVVLLVAFVAAEQKREAEPSRGGPGQASAAYPYHPIQKRAADPDHYGYGYPYGYGYGYPYGYGYGYPYGYGSYGLGASYGYQTTVQHPGNGVSYQYNHGVVPAYYW